MVLLQRIIIMSQNIENIQLKTFFIEQEVLMLRMYIDQLFAQFLHLCQRSRRIINECTAFAGRLHFAPQDTFLVVVFQFVLFKKRAHTVSRDIKTCFDNTFRSSTTNRFHIGTLSEQQTDSSQNNRFSGPRLACDDREACFKTDIQFFYQCVILNIK